MGAVRSASARRLMPIACKYVLGDVPLTHRLEDASERGTRHLVAALLLLGYELTKEVVGSRVDVPNPNSVAKAREAVVF